MESQFIKQKLFSKILGTLQVVGTINFLVFILVQFQVSVIGPNPEKTDVQLQVGTMPSHLHLNTDLIITNPLCGLLPSKQMYNYRWALCLHIYIPTLI